MTNQESETLNKTINQKLSEYEHLKSMPDAERLIQLQQEINSDIDKYADLNKLNEVN